MRFFTAPVVGVSVRAYKNKHIIISSSDIPRRLVRADFHLSNHHDITSKSSKSSKSSNHQNCALTPHPLFLMI
jgi:hypothetical protein